MMLGTKRICPICGREFTALPDYTGPTCGKKDCIEKYLELQSKNRFSSFMFDKILEEKMDGLLIRRRRRKEPVTKDMTFLKYLK